MNVAALKYLPELAIPLLQDIDDATDENQKRLLLNCALSKKFMSVLTSIVNLKGVRSGTAPVGEETLRCILVGDMSKFKLDDLIAQSSLRFSLPHHAKDSSRYRACMLILIELTSYFFPVMAKKYASFLTQFLAKDNGPESWKVLIDMEESYRLVVASSMTGRVDFGSNEFTVLQELFNQRCAKAYVETVSRKPKAQESPVKHDSMVKRCNNWNHAREGTPLSAACSFGPSCSWKHECNVKTCKGTRSTHRGPNCPSSKEEKSQPPRKKARVDSTGQD
jgi:hypothetical protein